MTELDRLAYLLEEETVDKVKAAVDILGEDNLAAEIVVRLVNDYPLTAITEEDFDGEVCTRCKSIHKEDGLIIDDRRFICEDTLGRQFPSNIASKFAHKIMKISLPYYPEDYPIKIKVDTLMGSGLYKIKSIDNVKINKCFFGKDQISHLRYFFKKLLLKIDLLFMCRKGKV